MQSFSNSVSHQSDFTTYGLGRDHTLELKYTSMTAYYSFYRSHVFSQNLRIFRSYYCKLKQNGLQRDHPPAGELKFTYMTGDCSFSQKRRIHLGIGHVT